MTLDDLERALRERAGGRIERNVRLAGFTTYRLGGPADLLFEPARPDDLIAAAPLVAGADVDVLVVGRGSNLVISDGGFRGLVIHLGAGCSSIVEEGDSGVRAGAGAPLPVVANWAARRSLSGLEFTIAIPGSIGGAVRMNAGAHGSDIGGRLVETTVVDLRTGRAAQRAVDDLELGYRWSNLTDRDVVLDARLALQARDPAEIKEEMRSYRQHRAETQPGAVQNAGSVFKNPTGHSAGRLVEAAGLKGFAVGGASVSELHANFFIAGEGSSAQDVFDLVHRVRALVAERHGIELEPEIRFVGEFRDPAVERARV